MRTMQQTARRLSLAASASYGPTVCMCACLYVWEICNATVRNKKTKQAGVFGWPATKQEEDCDETKKKKPTKRSWKAKFALKGERTFSTFLFFAD